MKLKSAAVSLFFCALLLVPAWVKGQVLKEFDFKQIFAGYNGCFVMQNLQDGTFLRYNPSQCSKRLSPCSTFKILNSLIGLETGVIPGADYLMKWDGRNRFIGAWNVDHTLKSAFANSVVWYYQELARRVGPERMSAYLHRVQYGNQDISGGLDRFWLCSSLLISADEQVAFLKRLYEERLPFSHHSLAIVKDISIVAHGADWELHGKTGSAKFDPGASDNLGWFVGYLVRADQCLVFALNIEAAQGANGPKAKEITLAILKRLELIP